MEVPVWKGALHGDSQQLFQGYTVQLTDSSRLPAASAEVRPDGSFEFRHVTAGEYHLVVSDSRGQVLYQDFLNISSNSSQLDVRLPEEKIERPPSGGVSAAQLLHPPDRKAVSCFKAALKASGAGQYAKAAEDLEKAVRISPEFAEAYTNLGAQYLHLGRNRDALDALQQALHLAPPNALTVSNLAYAQHLLSRDSEAIQSARWSLRLDPDYVQAHYILGMCLATAGRSIPEAIAHLEKAAEVFPSARISLERLRARAAN